MAYWLFKSEPSAWSWDDQKKNGAKGEPWTGVRNHQANNNMKAMKKGDLGFFYHSVEEKQIVGIVRVIGEHRPDPTDETGKFGLVVIEAVEDMPKPVTLAAIKAEPKLADSILLRMSRLSVQPVRDEDWKLICKMGGLKKAP
ncbi:MAG: EVE domain-containing protein [Parvibaculum sp.]|uniref:EVE domain-containing protein n=1 Tax=Parvibaculum sp. TaxID=2024848 RepID=UPI003C751B0F